MKDLRAEWLGATKPWLSCKRAYAAAVSAALLMFLGLGIGGAAATAPQRKNGLRGCTSMIAAFW